MSTETAETTAPNPFIKREFVIYSALLVAVAAVGAVVVALMWWDARSWERDTSVAACERPASKDYELTGPVPVKSWQSIGASALPVTDFGPSRQDGGAPTCYERSPQGAAMAAVYVATLASNGSTELVLEHLAADTPATQAALAATDVERVPETPARPVAVAVRDYSVEDAEVTVVSDTGRGTYAQDFRLVWVDGDWRWDTPTESIPATLVEHLTGYNGLEAENRG